MDDKHKIHRSHNVYILGAGFSRDAGLPLIADFLDQMRESANWIVDNGTKQEVEALQKVFQFRLRAAGAAYRAYIDVENIEELFSLASASERDSDDDYVSRAIAATLNCARSTKDPRTYKVFVDKTKIEPLPDWQEDKAYGQTAEHGNFIMSVYDFYAGVLSGLFCTSVPKMRNTVISFNYDTLLEDALYKLRVPYSYRLLLNGADYHRSAAHIGAALANPSAMHILKLHGSVNWGIKRRSSTEFDLSVYSDYNKLLADDRHPYLLPPTWRKVFAGALASVWNGALEAITEATRIIIIGFSMPTTDIHFKYLLAAGLRDNISLRDLIFINYGDCKALKENISNVLQPPLSKKIIWAPKGIQHTLMDRGFLESIDRALSPALGEILPY